jgi:hypothetical protein
MQIRFGLSCENRVFSHMQYQAKALLGPLMRLWLPWLRCSPKPDVLWCGIVLASDVMGIIWKLSAWHLGKGQGNGLTLSTASLWSETGLKKLLEHIGIYKAYETVTRIEPI